MRRLRDDPDLTIALVIVLLLSFGLVIAYCATWRADDVERSNLAHVTHLVSSLPRLRRLG